MGMAPMSSPSRPMKLLRSDLKPKLKPNSGPITPLPNSAASSSTAATAPPKKKTRELPNLSDCHGCNRRINRDNPKNHLQALDSVWRILLLCRKCRKSIHSGDTCSYCFRETGNSGDLFQCRVCERKIHKNCVRDYGDCSPWCYLGVGMEGCGVCVDCWVPDLLKNSFRVSERTGNKRGRKKKAEGKRLLEEGLKNAECDNEKAKRGRIAKKQKLNGTKLMKNAVDSGNEKDSTKGDNLNGNSTNGSSSEGVLNSKSLGKHSDEGQRLISSPNNSNWLNKVTQVLKGVNTDGSNSSGRCSQELLSYKRRRNTCQLHGTSDVNCLCKDFNRRKIGLLCYKRDKKRKKWPLNDDDILLSEVNHQKDMLNAHVDDTVTGGGVKSISDASEGPIDVNVDQINPWTNVDRFGRELVYRRTKFRWKGGLVNGSVDVQECSSGINGPCEDVNGAKLGLLTYKRGGKKNRQQLYGNNTVASDVGQQNSKFDVQLNVGFVDSTPINADIPEVSPDVTSDQTTDLCINVDESGRKVTNFVGEQVCSADLSEGSFDANADQSNLCATVDRFGREILCYERCRFGRKLFEVNGLSDASEGSNDVNGSCNDINGLNLAMLTYERNRNRKIWLLNDLGLGECSLKPASSR